jgi:hypothetical protein
MMDHIAACPRCALEHRLAGRALAMLAVVRPRPSTKSLRERILADASRLALSEPKASVARGPASPVVRRMRPIAAIALAASLLVAATAILWHPEEGSDNHSAFTLLGRAYAAEETLFAADRIVHLVNEIVVKPIANAEAARLRWFPIMSLEATGKTRFHQLALSANAGDGYTITDDVWFEAATGRFARQLLTDGRPIYANSYDGEDVYWLNVAADGRSQIEKRKTAAEFQPPENPEKLLGIAAGLPARLDETNKRLVADAGEVRLDDGTMARRVRAGYPGPGADVVSADAYVQFTIRQDDNTIARIEFVVGEESLYEVRRVKTETVARNDIAWNLAGLESRVADATPAPGPGIFPDMVIRNVTVDHMVEKASFPTYIFQSAPAWTDEGQITDILDVASPPNRMFATAYAAKDGRHVVLIQSATYNNTLGQAVAKLGKVVYTSYGGVKVISGAQDKWLAGILLQSARPMINDPPSEDRTGYLLETPLGTFPALAINGQLSDDELHKLIDSLAPAKGDE